MKIDAMKTMGLVAIALAAVVSLGACASGAAAPSSDGRAEADPATSENLVGVWVTGETYASPKVPFLDLADDGTWTGSDGCNGVQGEWMVADDGTLTVSAGPSTLIACDGAALPGMLSSAVLALMDGDSLVLADADGAPVLTLVAAPEGTVPDAAGAVIGTWSADAQQKAAISQG